MSAPSATPLAATELRSALAKKQLRTASVGALWATLAQKDLLGIQVATAQKGGASTLTGAATPPVTALRQWLSSHLSEKDVSQYDCGTLGSAIATTSALVPPAMLDATTLPDAMQAVIDVHSRFVPDVEVLQHVREALEQRGRAAPAVQAVTAVEADAAPALDVLASEAKKTSARASKKKKQPSSAPENATAQAIELSEDEEGE